MRKKRVLQYRIKQKKFNTKQHIRNINSVMVYGDNMCHIRPSKPSLWMPLILITVAKEERNIPEGS